MRIPFTATLLFCTAVTAALPLPAAAQVHLTEARQLIAALNSNPASVNVYGSPGHIDWSGDPRAAISECSSFLSMLLKHSYGYSDTAFRTKTGSTSPTAARYYDDIAAGKSFTAVPNPGSLLPGDTIAIKYPAGLESTGHAMTVDSVSPWQPRANSTQTFLNAGGFPEIAGFLRRHGSRFQRVLPRPH